MNLTEVANALKKGNRITHKDWPTHDYVQEKDGLLIDQDGETIMFTIDNMAEFDDEGYDYYYLKPGIYAYKTNQIVLVDGAEFRYIWNFIEKRWDLVPTSRIEDKDCVVINKYQRTIKSRVNIEIKADWDF